MLVSCTQRLADFHCPDCPSDGDEWHGDYGPPEYMDTGTSSSGGGSADMEIDTPSGSPKAGSGDPTATGGASGTAGPANPAGTSTGPGTGPGSQPTGGAAGPSSGPVPAGGTQTNVGGAGPSTGPPADPLLGLSVRPSTKRGQAERGRLLKWLSTSGLLLFI
jgi:hypothetical protein